MVRLVSTLSRPLGISASQVSTDNDSWTGKVLHFQYHEERTRVEFEQLTQLNKEVT